MFKLCKILFRSAWQMTQYRIVFLVTLLAISFGLGTLLLSHSVIAQVVSVFSSALSSVNGHAAFFSPTEKAGVFEKNLSQYLDSKSVLSQGPFLTIESLLVHKKSRHALVIKGVRWKNFKMLYPMQVEYLKSAPISKQNFSQELPILLGRSLAQELGLQLGDSFQVYLPKTQDLQNKKQYLKLRLEGLFESGLEDFDRFLAFVALKDLQDHLAQPGERGEHTENISGIEIRLSDKIDQTDFLEKLKLRLPEHYSMMTWQDSNRDLLQLLDFEQWFFFLLMTVLAVVCLFSLLGLISLMINSLKRELYILYVLGISFKSIRKTLMLVSAAISLMAASLGILSVFLLLKLFDNKWQDILDPEVYKIRMTSIHVDIQVCAYILVFAALLGFLAAGFASYRVKSLKD